MALPAKQELLIKDLPTSHVILYPSRAHITRSIGNVELQPGLNEIEIYGLTPTVDEQSIKVEGNGAASITDMTVDLVPNREFFQDVYPEDEDSDLDQSESDSDMESDTDADSTQEDVKSIRKELQALQKRYERNEESRLVSGKAMDLFSDYCAKVDAKEMDIESAEKLIKRYGERRLIKHDEIKENLEYHEELRKEISSKEKKLRLATKEIREQKRREEKQAVKAREKKQREKLDKAKKKQAIRDEHAKFWPKKLYRVVVHLDTASDTPGTSRRSSISSLATLQQESASKQKAKAVEGNLGARTISLTLSYVTSEAWWSPRYDITLSTPNKSGSIGYRAEFKNETSETWKDTKVSLSTSQASFRGLDDELPFMHPWHLGIAKVAWSGGFEPAGLKSLEEQSHINDSKQQNSTSTALDRWELFGIPKAVPPPQTRAGVMSGANMQNASASYGPPPQPPPAPAAILAAIQPPSGFGIGAIGLSGEKMDSAPRSSQINELSMSSKRFLANRSEMPSKPTYTAAEDDLTLSDNNPAPALEYEESTWEDHGLTQTYELPGPRTLEPSSLTRRSMIATLPFTNLLLTSISVPKLRAASFLRARFHNPSASVTLLRGTAGVTLDGTFLGSTTLSRIAPGDPIRLPLGVDPGVHVSYAKPTVKRSTQGVFTKEATQLFTRSVIVTNGKPVPAEVTVLDQVPISEDDKLRVELLQPAGLVKDGGVVLAGANAKQGRHTGEKWGKATATMRKGGEIAWTVNLERGAACRLVVEYEVKTPSNEFIVSK